MSKHDFITIEGAAEHNLKNINLNIHRAAITVVTGVSGSGKSSLAFDTVLAESQRRFFYTLSHYSRQFLDLGTRPVVKKITGLSPAIALAQNETAPSRRSTLGSLTDISELLAVMFVRFGETLCPTHGQPTAAMTRDQIIAHILKAAAGKTIGVVYPLATSKKGIFRKELTQLATKGFVKAWIDGDVVNLDPTPVLEREEKHTIKILVDLLKVKEDAPERLSRSIQAVLELSNGYGEWMPVDAKGNWQIEARHAFSTQSGCPVCGFSWPKLDSRYFNANSLGRCETCDGYGACDIIDDGESSKDDEGAENPMVFLDEPCISCRGTGVQVQAGAVLLDGLSIHDCLTMPINDLYGRLQQVRRSFVKSGDANPAFLRVFEEIDSALRRLIDMKLGYLSLERRVRSLSGGESQRVKLAGILSENLRGILYVLDEPSQGLHHTELAAMIHNLKKLRDQGNTVLIVDHDEDIMKAADYIVDLGPTGGVGGGHLLASFPPKAAGDWTKVSQTAAWLVRKKVAVKRKAIESTNASFLVFTKPSYNNLKMDKIRIPLEAMTVITGVSGAGKSSLVNGVIVPNLVDAMSKGVGKGAKAKWHYCEKFTGHDQVLRVDMIDRRPVAKSSVSMPATYLDVLGDLRDLYASLPDAQVAGLTAKSFSIHSEGGRCPECKGRGELVLSMRFLTDARVLCPVCRGRRFRSHVLDVKFNKMSIYDVLNLSVDEALTAFANHKKIVAKLMPAKSLGLGYLKLGQPSASLSGGESQRLKLVPYFSKRLGQGSVLLLDEPTTGLHFEDVARLVAVMRELVALGVTLVVIEHNQDVIRSADWCLALGPGSAREGGLLMSEGVPQDD